jgi:hypothetical protein
MAAAAAHKKSQAELDETFVLTNVSPQVGEGFNRHYWARLEKWAKDLTARHNAVYVVTGPLWLPTPATDGSGDVWSMRHGYLGTAPRLVAVPTHFFKVVLAADARGAPVAIQAFVLPNAPIPGGKPLTAFAVPLAALEEAAGLRFFERALDTASSRDSFAAREAAWLATLPPRGAGASRALLPPPRAGNAAAAAGAVAAGHAVSPLCAVDACTLPVENWWAAAGQDNAPVVAKPRQLARAAGVTRPESSEAVVGAVAAAGGGGGDSGSSAPNE